MKDEYEERKAEISDFFRFLSDLENDKCQIVPDERSPPYFVEAHVLKTLKANAFCFYTTSWSRQRQML